MVKVTTGRASGFRRLSTTIDPARIGASQL